MDLDTESLNSFGEDTEVLLNDIEDGSGSIGGFDDSIRERDNVRGHRRHHQRKRHHSKIGENSIDSKNHKSKSPVRKDENFGSSSSHSYYRRSKASEDIHTSRHKKDLGMESSSHHQRRRHHQRGRSSKSPVRSHSSGSAHNHKRDSSSGLGSSSHHHHRQRRSKSSSEVGSSSHHHHHHRRRKSKSPDVRMTSSENSQSRRKETAGISSSSHRRKTIDDIKRNNSNNIEDIKRRKRELEALKESLVTPQKMQRQTTIEDKEIEDEITSIVEAIRLYEYAERAAVKIQQVYRSKHSTQDSKYISHKKHITFCDTSTEKESDLDSKEQEESANNDHWYTLIFVGLGTIMMCFYQCVAGLKQCWKKVQGGDDFGGAAGVDQGLTIDPGMATSMGGPPVPTPTPGAETAVMQGAVQGMASSAASSAAGGAASGVAAGAAARYVADTIFVFFIFGTF